MTLTDKLDEMLATAREATLFPGYSVDAEGNVWSETNWRGYGLRKLTPFPNSHGYLTVKVKTENGMKKAFVHKLVCEAFHGPKPSVLHQVRHLDGNRRNNRAANLCWGTCSENARDRKLHGTERSAENGRKSAHKLRHPPSPYCKRGHHKNGQQSCNQCRRERLTAMRRQNRDRTNEQRP